MPPPEDWTAVSKAPHCQLEGETGAAEDEEGEVVLLGERVVACSPGAGSKGTDKYQL